MVSSKKGCVLSASVGAQRFQSVNPTWYYTWDVTPVPGLESIPFVPMCWGAKSISKFTGPVPLLLGFNEPDNSAQSNLTPQQALSLWPEVQAIGQRLGSPATAGNPAKSGSWLETFQGEYDFVCVHWYAPPNVSSFLSEIDNIWCKYKKPIWVTEFAVADWSGKFPGGFPINYVTSFMKDACAGLDARDYVERYTWKTRTPEDPNMGTSALFNDDGSLTYLGKTYASI